MPFIAWPVSGTPGSLGLFGDGSDGSATLDGVATVPWATLAGSVYTATRNPYLTSLTVNSGITLKLPGPQLFVRGTLTGAGIISSNGNNAAGATGGAATGSWILNNGQAGGTGTTGAGAAGTNGSPGIGGAGGGGGNSGATAGGGGGTVVAGGVSASALHLPWPVLTGIFQGTGASRLLGGAAGGGSGAGDGTSAGGGGGSGAGMVAIFAQQITGTLTLQAIGGNGAAGVGGNAGGGGGGGGGGIWVGSLTAAVGLTTAVTGGALGAGAGTGAAGVAGSAGAVQTVVLA